MSTLELRANIHAIVDRIQSDHLLNALYDFLKAREGSQVGSLWATLTPEQQAEVLQSYEESKDESNWVDAREALKKRK